jgi:hypothetical protein
MPVHSFPTRRSSDLFAKLPDKKSLNRSFDYKFLVKLPKPVFSPTVHDLTAG